MRVFGAAIASMFLTLVASVAVAESDCVGERIFGGDGRTSRWTTCNVSLTTDIIDSEAGSFRITLMVGDDSISDSFRWSEVSEPPDGERTFVAASSLHSIEVSRTVSEVSKGNFTETISVSNLSQNDLVDVRVRVEVRHPVNRDVAELAGLAKQLYGFEKFMHFQEPGEWRRAVDGDIAERVALYSRHRVLATHASEPLTLNGIDGLTDAFLEYHLNRVPPLGVRSLTLVTKAVATSTPAMARAELPGLMYSDLWNPLATLSRAIERSLAMLTALLGNLGVAMMALAVLIRIATSPITYWSFRNQKRFGAINMIMKPEILEIRKTYKGAEQSERILAVYKKHGISPFSGLKGSVGLFIQIPFLLAVFHVTTESNLFEYARFLWIQNLAVSDSLVELPFSLPFLGSALNILPLSLGVLNIMSGKKDSASSGTSSITPVAISLLIVFLFYTVSSALVLYWLTINILQAIEKTGFSRRLDRQQADSVIEGNT